MKACIVVALAFVLATACGHEASFQDCSIRCEAGCPDGFLCIDGYCRTGQSGVTCSEVLVDAALDGKLIDGAPVDSTPVDGPTAGPCMGVNPSSTDCTVFECAGTCHQVCYTPGTAMSWDQASTACTTWGGGLTKIESAVEDACIISKTMIVPDSKAWIGLRQDDNQPTVSAGWFWVYPTKAALGTYTGWESPPNPNDGSSSLVEDNDQNCARTGKVGWDDKDCNDTGIYAFTCER